MMSWAVSAAIALMAMELLWKKRNEVCEPIAEIL